MLVIVFINFTDVPTSTTRLQCSGVQFEHKKILVFAVCNTSGHCVTCNNMPGQVVNKYIEFL